MPKSEAYSSGWQAKHLPNDEFRGHMLDGFFGLRAHAAFVVKFAVL